jgi:hypothetical protein
VYPINAGNVRIKILSSNGYTIFSSGSINVSNNPQGVVLSCNAYLNGFQTYDIFIYSVNTPVLFQYNTSGINYPLTAPGGTVSILGYVDSVFHNTPDLYQFYDLQIAEGCRSAASNVTVDVYPILPAGISAIGPTSFCRGGSVTLTASPSTGSFQYSWMLNGNIIPGANSVSYTATSAGSYQARVQNLNCTGISVPISVRVPCFPVGPHVEKETLSDDEHHQLLTVYLDNFQNQLVIDVNSGNSQLMIITCYNQLGQLVISDQQSLEPGSHTITKNFSELESGVYLVKIWTNNEVIVKKVAKY